MSLTQDDGQRVPLDLAPGTSLRYEGSGWFNAYWNGELSWTIRRFQVLDGEHQGQKVTHTQWTHRHPPDTSSSDLFPPAGLEAMPEPVTGQGNSQEHH
jgi:hypothetical protein